MTSPIEPISVTSSASNTPFPETPFLYSPHTHISQQSSQYASLPSPYPYTFATSESPSNFMPVSSGSNEYCAVATALSNYRDVLEPSYAPPQSSHGDNSLHLSFDMPEQLAPNDMSLSLTNPNNFINFDWNPTGMPDIAPPVAGENMEIDMMSMNVGLGMDTIFPAAFQFELEEPKEPSRSSGAGSGSAPGPSRRRGNSSGYWYRSNELFPGSTDTMEYARTVERLSSH